MSPPRNEHPVTAIGDERLRVSTERGSGIVPFYRSADETRAHSITTIVIMLHGRLRDADAYLLSARRALAAAAVDPSSTLLVAPQFLAAADIAAHALSADTLRWEWTAWMGGDDALGPAPLSSFDVLDALIAHFADRARYPALRDVVIAGHSGGAQVAHRYAIVGRADAACAASGVHCRYVIANPSSYVYFDASRPDGSGSFQLADTASCPSVDHWKYGVQRPPRYAATACFSALETRYAATDVIYLLGYDDRDPAHEALDRSCAAMAQGPHRLARGLAYIAYLRARHPQITQRCWEVPGVGHNGEAMFGSREGVQALFGVERAAELSQKLSHELSQNAGGASD